MLTVTHDQEIKSFTAMCVITFKAKETEHSQILEAWTKAQLLKEIIYPLSTFLLILLFFIFYYLIDE